MLRGPVVAVDTMQEKALRIETVYERLVRNIAEIRTHLEHLEDCKRLFDEQPGVAEVVEAMRKAGV